MEAVLADGEVLFNVLEDVKQRDRSLWQRMIDWLNQAIEKLGAQLGAAYSGVKPDSAEGQLISEMQDALQELKQIYAEGLTDAARAQRAAQKNTAENGGGKQSIRSEFASELDAWDGKSKITFRVGRTSEVLKEIGVKDAGIIWHGGKIAKILREHFGMTKEVIKQVPEILEHPVIVLASKNSDSRLAIFGTVKDANGTPVTAILELEPTARGGRVMDLNVIASAYGKDNTKRFLESSGVLYLDPNAKRTDSWMQGLGLQLPSGTNAVGSVGSVSYSDGKVKIDSIPFAQLMQSNTKYSFRAPYGYEGVRKATMLEQQGKDSETIRRETGLFRSYDGKWRVEMDDSEMVLADTIEDRMRLGELIEHDLLFDAYPDMERMIVRFSPMKKGHHGQYSSMYDEIKLNKALKDDREELKNSLLHELQHAIQHREGFASGASVEYWQSRIDEGYDTRRQAAIDEEREYRSEYDRIQREEPEYFADMMELEGMTPNVPRGRFDYRTLEKIEEDPPEWQAYDARREALEEQYGDDRVFEFIELMYHLQRAEKLHSRDARTLYYETAGEIEARDVEARRKMTREERKENRPHVDYKDAVIAGETRYSLRDKPVPTREELEAKPPMRVVDISTPQTTGSFAERRRQIMANIGEIIAKPYLNKDTNTYIFLTKKSYTHAFSNQGELNISAAEHLPELIEEAVLVCGEKPTHGDENADGVYTFFAAAKADAVHPVKLKVKEYFTGTGRLPENIARYFEETPDSFATTYDTVVLEVEEIEESPAGSAMAGTKTVPEHSPDELSEISVAELLESVKGEGAKYIPERKYSQRDRNAQRRIAVLERQNERLGEDVKRLKELVKLQRKATGGKVLERGSVELESVNIFSLQNDSIQTII